MASRRRASQASHCPGKTGRRSVERVKIERSSGNVFADLELPDADKLKIKSGLVIEIARGIRRLGLTQHQAAERMGISQPKVSGLLKGDFANLSERKLMDCLNRLGYDIQIKVQPTRAEVGALTLAIG
ncbi:MAG: helix-turn-helix transcriptional regulator [Burkholderiaceae bacterium]